MSPPKLPTNPDGSLALDEDGDLLEPPEGWVWHQMPPNRKYYWDPGWYDTRGRNPLEQRKAFKLSHADQVPIYLEILQETPDRALDLMFRAAANGNDPAVRALLERGISPIARADQDVTLVPLHAACYNGHIKCVKVLIEEHGMDMNFKDEGGSTAGGTPLMRAARGGHADIVAWLLERGADTTCVQKTFPSGQECNSSAFEYGAESGNVEVIKLLMNHDRSDFTVTPESISLGAQSGSEEMMRFLLERGGYPVLLEDGTSADPWAGDSMKDEQRKAILDALWQAAYSNSTPVLKLLLGCLTPLPKRRLLPHGLRYSRIGTVIGGAAYRDNIDSFELLLDVAFDPTVPVNDERASELAEAREWYIDQALIQASRFGSLHLAKHLLDQRNAKINFIQPPSEKATPLYRAAENGHISLVEMLVQEYKADLHIGCGSYANGPTALWVATRNIHSDVVKVLLEFGGPVETIKNGINTASTEVFVVAREGYRYPVELHKSLPDDVSGYVHLDFPDGNAWLENLQMRKDDADLKTEGREVESQYELR